MSDQNANGPPFSESNLDSPEYREKLLRKLNYLITVLELAIGKVHRSLAGPEPDVERLLKIRKNLQDTLHVCVRARTALEKRGTLSKELSADLERTVNVSRELSQDSGRRVQVAGPRVEMTSD